MAERRINRAPVVGGVAALLLAGGLADRYASPTPPVPGGTGSAVVAPAAALSSSWFCAGASATTGSAPGSLAIANSSGRPERATVTLVPDVGGRSTTVVPVAAHGVADVPEAVAAPAHWVAAEVDLDGGAAAVEQQVAGPDGSSAAPCSDSGSGSWWFAGGATLVNASETVSLYNPYDSDAIVDLSFTTNQGGEVPGDFQGLDVPPRGLVAVDLGSHLRRRTQIALAVHARTGRVVAATTEVVSPPAAGEAVVGGPADPSAPSSSDPADPDAGVTVAAGADTTSTRLVWPSGVTGGGLDERYVVYNPGSSTAAVTLSLALDQGQAEPFALQVGPGQVTTVDADTEARVPPGVGHSATLRSTNGVGVVAFRQLDGTAPATAQGAGTMAGEVAPATSWLVPVAGAGQVTSDLVVEPTGRDPLTFTVRAVDGGTGAPLPGLAGVVLAPGSRDVVALSSKVPGLRGAVVVEATGPVYVEDDLSSATGLGYSLAPGLPLS